jgi:acyl carrier protein
LVEVSRDSFGVPVDELAGGATFEMVGLDSLALIEFTLVLQREFGVPMKDDDLTADQTIDDVATLLASKGAA